MKEDIERYVTGCPQCQKGKPRTGKVPIELHPTPILPGLWKHIGWDIVGPITKSAGKDAILCITDLFTKAIKLEAITTKITTKGIARIFRDRVFCEEGLPEKIYSDRGLQFAGHFTKELMALLHIKLNISTPYHPQTDRQTERVNREIGKYLRIFAKKQSDWMDWISAAEFAYNNSLHSATGFTPFWLNKGRHPTGHPSEIISGRTVPVVDDFAKQIQISCDIVK